MYGLYGNVLKKSRKDSGLTQIQASMRFNCSVETIQKYEKGTSRPSEDFVVKAKQVYKDNTLGAKYLSMVSIVGKEEVPQIAVLYEVCRQLSIVAPQIMDALNNAIALTT